MYVTRFKWKQNCNGTNYFVRRKCRREVYKKAKYGTREKKGCYIRMQSFFFFFESLRSQATIFFLCSDSSTWKPIWTNFRAFNDHEEPHYDSSCTSLRGTHVSRLEECIPDSLKPNIHVAANSIESLELVPYDNVFRHSHRAEDQPFPHDGRIFHKRK